ncbi:basic salivary proline-rich protein 2-like [Eptesicus fuscus]|uniref:basic salivary proline-rich protein 2-like n=1 Tax=Eptesicus fuscus TaxID=29078 RepID=UPI002404099C|nr:basic salivary proline-rich protein 2-like [Eptesicus fuscus]
MSPRDVVTAAAAPQVALCSAGSSARRGGAAPRGKPRPGLPEWLPPSFSLRCNEGLIATVSGNGIFPAGRPQGGGSGRGGGWGGGARRLRERRRRRRRRRHGTPLGPGGRGWRTPRNPRLSPAPPAPPPPSPLGARCRGIQHLLPLLRDRPAGASNFCNRAFPEFRGQGPIPQTAWQGAPPTGLAAPTPGPVSAGPGSRAGLPPSGATLRTARVSGSRTLAGAGGGGKGQGGRSPRGGRRRAVETWQQPGGGVSSVPISRPRPRRGPPPPPETSPAAPNPCFAPSRSRCNLARSRTPSRLPGAPPKGAIDVAAGAGGARAPLTLKPSAPTCPPPPARSPHRRRRRSGAVDSAAPTNSGRGTTGSASRGGPLLGGQKRSKPGPARAAPASSGGQTGASGERSLR